MAEELRRQKVDGRAPPNVAPAELGAITGDDAAPDLLHEIFSRLCLGKRIGISEKALHLYICPR